MLCFWIRDRTGMTAPHVVFVYFARVVYQKWHDCPKLFHIWNNIKTNLHLTIELYVWD